MLARQCRAKRSHRIGKSRLMQGDDIHISLTEQIRYFFLDVLAQYAVRTDSGFYQTQSVSGEFRYLGLRVSHHAAAEADHPVVDIHDREHHPVPELVIHALALVDASTSPDSGVSTHPEYSLLPQVTGMSSSLYCDWHSPARMRRNRLVRERAVFQILHTPAAPRGASQLRGR